MNKTNILKNIGLAGLAATVLTGGDRPVQPEQPVVSPDHITTLVDVPNEGAAPFQKGTERLFDRSGKEVVEGYSAFLEAAKHGSFFTLAEYRDFTPETQQVVTILAEVGIWGNIRGADGSSLTLEEISQLGELFGVATEYVRPQSEKILYLRAGAFLELTGIEVLTLSGGAETNAIRLSRGDASVSIPVRSYRGSFFHPNETFEDGKKIVITSEVNTSGTSSILEIHNQDGDPIQAILVDPSWIRPDLTHVERDDAYQFALNHLIPVTPELDEAVSLEKFLDQAFMHTDGSRLYFPNTHYDFSLVQLDYNPLVVITNSETGQKWTLRTTYHEKNFSLPNTLRHSGLVSGMSVAINPNDPYSLDWTLHRSYATGSAYKQAVVESDLTFEGNLDWPAQSELVESYESTLSRHPSIRLLVDLGYPIEAQAITDVPMQQKFIRAFDKAYYDLNVHQGSIVFPADAFEWEFNEASIVVKGIDPETNEPVILTLLPEYFDAAYDNPFYDKSLEGDLCINPDGVFLTIDYSTWRVSSSIGGSFISDGTDLGDIRLSSLPNFD